MGGLHIRESEVFAFEQQRFAPCLRQRIGETVSKI